MGRGRGRGREARRGSSRPRASAPRASPALLQRLLPRGKAGPAERRAKGALELPPPRGAVLSESAPSGVASGLQAAREGARARAQGLYVNGDSGGGRGEGSGAAGRARSGPGGRSWLSGVDGDDLTAAAADQHHPVQVLREDLEELHV